MVLNLVLPELYPYAMMGLAANFFLFNMMGPLFILPARRKAFTIDRLNQFDNEHKQVFGPNAQID